jgi:DNA-binding response OmpR family regulator
MYKILIVEDDRTISKLMAEGLMSWGYQVCQVSDFQNVMSDFLKFAPHMVLMDITLPFFNGYHWCQEIRKVSSVPIVFVSSASDGMNIVMAVNMGGDDFITKPFDMNVLMAKVQAMIRRTYEFAGETEFMEHRGAMFNISDGSLTYKDSKLSLTKNEMKIMHILLKNKGHIVSRTDIMEFLWMDDSFVDENTLTVNITRIRKKLEEIGLDNFISTRKGQGYIIE